MCLSWQLEIVRILKKGLDSIIQERNLQRLAYRLHDILLEIANTVDFQVFGDFGTILMAEMKDWGEKISDLSPVDQAEARDLIKDFYQVHLFSQG